MKYPIGIQSFSEIRRLGCIYVDKTAIMHRLLSDYKYVFLGRPRRFGKSLLLSTIQAYYEGRKELFGGLAIERLTDEWSAHPVLHFDLNNGNYQANGLEELYKQLDYQLSQYESIYGGIDSSLSVRFLNVIRKAREKTGKNVVVLIDEYDKPILSTLDTKSEEDVRNMLKSFYGCLKSSDAYLQFAMLTGVSKFGKLSVFSDLNNIEDISFNENFASICGITEAEILDYFDQEIDTFAENRKITPSQMVEDLRKQYDGYRFSPIEVYVYNPYSLLNALKNKKLKDYWFESGTPTFLVNLLSRKDYSLPKLEDLSIEEDSLYKVDNVSVVPLLYQSGYLTIKEYNEDWHICTLGYPNLEVKAGFLNFLLPFYSSMNREDADIEIYSLINDIKAGDVDAFMARLQSIFYAIPYAQDNSAKVQEDQFRNLMYLVFRLIGMNIHVECPMSRGRTDAIVETTDCIYVLEFKMDSTPDDALRQIRDRGYALPFSSDPRTVIFIGVNYSTTQRAITGWKAEKLM